MLNVTPQERAEARALGIDVLALIAYIHESVTDDKKLTMDEIGRSIITMATLAPRVIEYVGDSEENRHLLALLIAETLDAATGTDATAINSDLIPGLDPLQEEAMFDTAKDMLERVGGWLLPSIDQAIAEAETEELPPPS